MRLKTSTLWESVFRSCSTADTVRKASLFVFVIRLSSSHTQAEIYKDTSASTSFCWCFSLMTLWMLMDWGQRCGLIIFSSVKLKTCISHNNNNTAAYKFTNTEILVFILKYSGDVCVQPDSSVLTQSIRCVYRRLLQIKNILTHGIFISKPAAPIIIQVSFLI